MPVALYLHVMSSYLVQGVRAIHEQNQTDGVAVPANLLPDVVSLAQDSPLCFLD